VVVPQAGQKSAPLLVN
jgi:hypothetical protein